MASEYRRQLFQLLFKPETSFGTENATVFGNGNYFGLHSTINLPDPQYRWIPLYGLAANRRAGNARSWPLIHYGKQEFSGSFSEMILIAGHVLPFLLGTDAAVNAGTYIEHDIREAQVLPSFTLDARFYNADSRYGGLIRRWVGCKIDTATLYCEQQGYLMLSLDKFLAKNMTHNIGEVADVAAERTYLKYDSSLVDGTPQEYPFAGNRDPYLFSGAQLQLVDGGNLRSPSDNITLRRVSHFSLKVDNNLSARYYDVNSSSSTDEIQTPYEFLEGRREYEISIVADIADHDFYKYLAFQGRYGQEKRGVGIRIIFTKRPGILTDNLIEIRIPGDNANHDWDSGVTAVNPVSGENTPNINLGAFAISAPHNLDENIRPRVNLRFIVPSVSFLVRDAFGHYLSTV